MEVEPTVSAEQADDDDAHRAALAVADAAVRAQEKDGELFLGDERGGVVRRRLIVADALHVDASFLRYQPVAAACAALVAAPNEDGAVTVAPYEPRVVEFETAWQCLERYEAGVDASMPDDTTDGASHIAARRSLASQMADGGQADVIALVTDRLAAFQRLGYSTLHSWTMLRLELTSTLESSELSDQQSTTLEAALCYTERDGVRPTDEEMRLNSRASLCDQWLLTTSSLVAVLHTPDKRIVDGIASLCSVFNVRSIASIGSLLQLFEPPLVSADIDKTVARQLNAQRTRCSSVVRRKRQFETMLRDNLTLANEVRHLHGRLSERRMASGSTPSPDVDR